MGLYLLDQWPWHASLYQVQGIVSSYICGGTLISTRHILTAAHCVTKPQSSILIPKNSLVVYLGLHNLHKFDSNVQHRLIDEIFVHPRFNAHVYFNDIAMLKISSPVVINKFVRTCCLWEGNSDIKLIINQLGNGSLKSLII